MELCLQVIELLEWQEHPNDVLRNGVIIPCCPKCQSKRRVRTTERSKDDHIAIVYLQCVACNSYEACPLDDRMAVVLRPI